jgi:methylated-DNA-[protein]-cysteine S-methyltransferase
MSYVFTAFQSPVGELKLVASDQGLMAILWANDNPNRVPLGSMKRDDANPVLIQTRLQLEQYFAGKRQRFVLPLNFVGTDFQKLVWQSLLTIPFGETRSYGQIALQIGKPKAARAVGIPMVNLQALPVG